MSWSRVDKKHKKPLIWWYHKIICEYYYFTKGSGSWYYKHLNKMCELGFNLYGEKINGFKRSN